MDTRVKVYSSIGAAVTGAVLAGGLSWAMWSSPSDDDEPVPLVRTPCNLVDQALLEEVLPGARITSESLSDEPGAEGRAGAECIFQAAKGRRLTVGVHRHGSVEVPKNRSRSVTVAASEAAKRFYVSETEYPEVECSPQPVSGIGEQAAACSGTLLGGPAHLVIARAREIVVTVTAELPAPDGQERLRRLTAAVLERA